MVEESEIKEKERQGKKKTVQTMLGGTIGESLAACIAAVLCIIGLTKMDEVSWVFSSAATIAIELLCSLRAHLYLFASLT